jgi:hypothetical protein
MFTLTAMVFTVAPAVAQTEETTTTTTEVDDDDQGYG